jgi:hypothetical protein
MRFEMIFVQIFEAREAAYPKGRSRTERENVPKSDQRSRSRLVEIGSQSIFWLKVNLGHSTRHFKYEKENRRHWRWNIGVNLRL